MTDAPTAKELVEAVAKHAAVIGAHAGSGGMENAGAILSALAAHPHLINAYVADPSETYFANLQAFRPEAGCLTWHAAGNGRVVHPAELRAHLGKRDQ